MSERQQSQIDPRPTATASSLWRHPLWVGRGKPAIRWRSLIGGPAMLLLANVVFALALATIRWPMPLKLVGIACLILAAGAIFLGVRALIRFVVQLGIRRLFIFLAALYLIAVVVVGLLTPAEEQGIGHWLASATSVVGWAVGRVGDLGRAALQAPGAVSFAATGRRQPIRVPGAEWVGGVPPTPIVVRALPVAAPDLPVQTAIAPESEQVAPPVPSAGRGWQVGDTVRVAGTGADQLRAHADPSVDAKTVARFPTGSTLQIVDGPQTVDGRVWWRVRGAGGEGWCAADFLTLIE